MAPEAHSEGSSDVPTPVAPEEQQQAPEEVRAGPQLEPLPAETNEEAAPLAEAASPTAEEASAPASDAAAGPASAPETEAPAEAPASEAPKIVPDGPPADAAAPAGEEPTSPSSPASAGVRGALSSLFRRPLQMVAITSYWSGATAEEKQRKAASLIAALARGNSARALQQKRALAATKIAAAVRGKQARRATWERAKALQVLALAGLAQEGEDQRASLGSLAALPERSQRRIFSAVYYERPIGLILRSGERGQTKVSAVSGPSADQGVPVGSIVLEINEEPVDGLGRQAVASLISSAAMPLEVRLDVTDTQASSVTYLSFPSGLLGLGLVFPTDGRVLVSSVERDSLSAERGVTVGSELLEINRERVAGLGRAAVVERIRTSPRPMAMKLDIAAKDCHSVITATFPDGPTGLGVRFPKDGRVVVTSVEAGSHADRAGVPAGSALLDINKTPVQGLGREKVLAMIAEAVRPMFARFDITGAKILTATFQEGSKLGLKLTFPASGLVLVSSVDEGSQAEDQGVPVGSSLLEIGDQVLRGMGKDEVLTIIETAPRPVTMRIDISGGSIYTATFDEGPLGLNFEFTPDGRALVSAMDSHGQAIARGVTIGSALLSVNDKVAGGLGEDGVLDLIGDAPRPVAMRFDLTGGKPEAAETAGLGRLLAAPPPPPTPTPKPEFKRQQTKKQVASNRVRRLSLAAGKVEDIERRVQQELRMSLASTQGPSSPRLSASRMSRSSASAAGAAGGGSRPSLASTKKNPSFIDRRSGEPIAGMNDADGNLLEHNPDPEPDLHGKETLTKEDVEAWVEWARREALIRLEAENAHPRLQTYVESAEGTKRLVSKKLPLMCTTSDIMEVFGVGVRLYFDLIRFFLGMSLLGALISIPSFYANSFALVSSAYGSGLSFGQVMERLNFPSLFAVASLGARVQENDPTYGVHLGCTTLSCERLNTVSAALELLYVLLYFYAVRTFQAYARKMTVYQYLEKAAIEDYSVMIYGLRGLSQVDPEEGKAFVEAAVHSYATDQIRKYDRRIERVMRRGGAGGLARVGRYYQGQKNKWMEFLAEGCERVADITMIADDGGLLRELCRLAPLEERVPTLRNKLAIAEKSGANGCKVCMLRHKLTTSERRLRYERSRTDQLAEDALTPIGAFVTFERERAKYVALDMWKPTTLNLYAQCFQPAYAKLTIQKGDKQSKRVIRAYEAPPPQDVRYENLPVKFAVSTVLRRACANCLLVLIIIIGMATVLAGVVVKNEADLFVRLLTTPSQGVANGVIAGATELGNLTFANVTAANATAAYTTCSPQQRELVLKAAGNPIDLLSRLTRQEVSGKLSNEVKMLTVALFRCWAGPLLSGATSFLIVLINAIITLLVRWLCSFSRYATLTDRYVSQVFGLHMAQFFNTGIILILVNAASGPRYEATGFEADWWKTTCPLEQLGENVSFFQSFACIFGPKGFLLRGNHFDLSPRWYTDVGASLCLTLMIIYGSRFFTLLAYAALSHYRVRYRTKAVRHLVAMKKLLTGPDPNLPELLGKTYTFVSLALLLSTPMPVLHIFSLVYLSTAYLMDKWYLLRICRKPTPYSDRFIRDTLWWVKWILVLKLVLAVWAFGSMPGTMLSDAVNIARRTALDLSRSAGGVGSATVRGASRAVQMFLTNQSDNFVLQRIATVGSLVLAVGVLFLVVLILLHFACYQVSTLFLWELLGMCCKREFEPAGWPAENAAFSKLIEGNARSERVRVFTPPDDTGRGEVLVLQSDIDSSCLANCKGPISLLLYIFGLKTVRPRVKSVDSFLSLPKKAHTITGKANMSFAPHFMPLYEAAFRYAEEHKPPPSEWQSALSYRADEVSASSADDKV